MTPAGKLLAQRARERFIAAIAGSASSLDLGRVALLIAAEEEPQTNVEHYLLLLDEWGETARARIARRSFGAAVEAFNQFMFEELDFTGNQTDYYDARNSFLNEVINRRTGIPLTLSIVYMLVSRRAGFHVEGIGLPGHFIVRLTDENDSDSDMSESVFVDPFHGRTLTRAGCQDLLDTVYGGHIALAEEHLRAATNTEILVRLLTNLKGIYVSAKLLKRALHVIERILLLKPDAVNERRDRAALLAQTNRAPEAITELRHYLRAATDAPDKESVREQLKSLHAQAASLN
jgi:regulator of sirC expression with transglutaminase-like and TPR domain